MRRLIYFLLMTATLAVFSSCSTTLYVANTVNAPLLKEKGEIKLNIDQNNIQAAVAVSDHLGIMANGFYRSYEGGNNYEHKGGLGEIGVGYFKTLNEKH